MSVDCFDVGPRLFVLLFKTVGDRSSGVHEINVLTVKLQASTSILSYHIFEISLCIREVPAASLCLCWNDFGAASTNPKASTKLHR